MIQIYLASGWFNEIQKKLMNEIHNTLLDFQMNHNGIEIFAPFWDGVVLKPTDSREKWKEVFDLDVDQIAKSGLMIASIEGFEPGTIFETGVAYALDVPVITYSSVPGRGLNLMLAQSSIGFANSPANLLECLEKWYINYKQGFISQTINKWEGEPI